VDASLIITQIFLSNKRIIIMASVTLSPKLSEKLREKAEEKDYLPEEVVPS